MKKHILTSCLIAVSAVTLFALPVSAEEEQPCAGQTGTCVKKSAPEHPGCPGSHEGACQAGGCEHSACPDKAEAPEGFHKHGGPGCPPPPGKCDKHEGPEGIHKHGGPGCPPPQGGFGRHGGHGAPPPPPSPEMQMKRLNEELNLTDDQQKKVLNILQKNEDKRRREFEAERKAMEEHFREMHKKAQAEREAVDKEIESVLNADQKAKFAQLRQEREDRMKHRPHKRHKHHHAKPAAESEK